MKFSKRIWGIFDLLYKKTIPPLQKHNLSLEIIHQLSKISKRDKGKVCIAKSSANETVLSLAIKKNMVLVVHYFLTTFPVDLNGRDMGSGNANILPLHFACETGAYKGIILALIGGGADCAKRSPPGSREARTLTYTPVWYAIRADNPAALTILLAKENTFCETTDLLEISLNNSAIDCLEYLISTRTIDDTNNLQNLYTACLKGMRFVKALLRMGYRFNPDFTRKHPTILHEFYATNHLQGATVECSCAEFTTVLLSDPANVKELTVDPSLIRAILNKVGTGVKLSAEWGRSEMKAFYFDLESTVELLGYHYPTLLASLPTAMLEERIEENFYDLIRLDICSCPNELILMFSLLIKMMKRGTRITAKIFRIMFSQCRNGEGRYKYEDAVFHKLGHLTCCVLHLSILQQNQRNRALHFCNMIDTANVIEFKRRVHFLQMPGLPGLSPFSEAVIQEMCCLVSIHSATMQYVVSPNALRASIPRFAYKFTTGLCQYISEYYDRNDFVYQVLEIFVISFCSSADLKRESNFLDPLYDEYFTISQITKLIHQNSVSNKGDPQLHKNTTKMLLLCFLYMVDQLAPHMQSRCVQGLWAVFHTDRYDVYSPYQANMTNLSHELIDNWEIMISLKSLCVINIRSCLMNADPVIPLSADSYSSFNGNPEPGRNRDAVVNAKLVKATSALTSKTKQLLLPWQMQRLIIGKDSAITVTNEMRKLTGQNIKL